MYSSSCLSAAFVTAVHLLAAVETSSVRFRQGLGIECSNVSTGLMQLGVRQKVRKSRSERLSTSESEVMLAPEFALAAEQDLKSILSSRAFLTTRLTLGEHSFAAIAGLVEALNSTNTKTTNERVTASMTQKRLTQTPRQEEWAAIQYRR